MLSDHRSVDATSYVESALHAHEVGVAGTNQIIQNAIGHSLMKCALVAKRPGIKLERFQFDAKAIRDILQEYRGEVRLPCLWAQACELWDFYMDRVIPAHLRIVKGFKHWLGRTSRGSNGVRRRAANADKGWQVFSLVECKHLSDCARCASLGA